MEVKVLGFGCASCSRLYDDVERAIRQLGLEATLSKVESLEEMAPYRVKMTPALVINGEVKAAGRIPAAAELTSWLTTAALQEATR